MVDPETALLVPPAVIPTFGVKPSVGILPAPSCQITELGHTAKPVVGWTIRSGNTSIEIATKDRLSTDYHVAS